MTVAPDAADRALHRRNRTVALLIFFVWMAWLGWLVITQANPVTIHRPQVRRAALDGLLAVSRVLDETSGRCRIERIIAAAPTVLDSLKPGDEITVTNLAAADGKASQVYVLPLVVEGDHFEVAADSKSGLMPIYPDTPEAEEQIDSLLRSAGS